jgi:hypothetical protein
MTPTKTTVLKPKPKGQRPHCAYCEKELEPQFVQSVMPAKLKDGRRHAEREAWEKANPRQFTGHYGRLKDDRFCGASCGYSLAIEITQNLKQSAKRRA